MSVSRAFRARGRRFAESMWRPALLLLLVVGAWWVVADRELVANYLVPRPGQVLDVLTDQWSFLMRQTWVTFYETVLGFVLAVAFGLLGAVLIVYSRSLEKAIYPLVLFAQVIPKIAIAPL